MSSACESSEPEFSSPPSSPDSSPSGGCSSLSAGSVAFLVLAQLLGHFHRRPSMSAHGARESLLVVELFEQIVEAGAGAFLDPVAPQIDDLPAALRCSAAGQFFRGPRGRVPSSRGASAWSVTLARLARVELVLEHRAEIVGHAHHGAGTDGFDARLLDRVEDGACLATVGGQSGVEAHVVAGGAQGHGNRRAHGQSPDPPRSACAAVRAAGRLCPTRRRAVLGESHLELAVAGNRAHAGRQRALEGVGVAALARFSLWCCLLGLPCGSRPGSAQDNVGGRFRQVFAKGALVEFGHHRTLQLVALV